MYRSITVTGYELYRIYGPHVYIRAPINAKYLFSDGTYWQPTDIPVSAL